MNVVNVGIQQGAVRGIAIDLNMADPSQWTMDLILPHRWKILTILRPRTINLPLTRTLALSSLHSKVPSKREERVKIFPYDVYTTGRSVLLLSFTSEIVTLVSKIR